MARYNALLDACVLVPISLADTLLRIAEAGLYRPLWSERILDEVVAAIVAVHPALPSGAARRRASVMQSSSPDATVADWQDIEAGHTPRPGRQARRRGGLQGRADMIVTANLRDFPEHVIPGLDPGSPPNHVVPGSPRDLRWCADNEPVRRAGR